MIILVVTFLVLALAVAGAAYLSVIIRGLPLDMAFLGALIGAAGTIFAATVAYVAVQKQLDAAEQQNAAGKRAQAQFKKEQTQREIDGLKSATQQLSEILAIFEGVPEEKLRERLIEAYRAAKFPLNVIGNPPVEEQGRMQGYLQRLQMLGGQINSLPLRFPEPAMLAADPAWRVANRDIADLLTQGRNLKSELERAILARGTSE